MSIFSDILGGAISPIAGLIDSLHTSEDEKLQAKAALLTIQADLTAKVLSYEATLAQEQASVIRAEAGGSWLSKSWRPIVMLVFTGLVVAYWFGWSAPNMTETAVLSVFGLIKIGLGGYVVGRSAEKIVPSVVTALKSKEQA